LKSAGKNDNIKGRKTGVRSVFAMVAIGLFLAMSLLGCAGTGVSTGEYPEEIDVQDAYKKYKDGVLLLDVRTPEEWDMLHAPNSTLIPLDELAERVDELPQDQEIVIICRSGNRSLVARDILVEFGFEKTSSVAGGFNEWTVAGYPIVQ